MITIILASDNTLLVDKQGILGLPVIYYAIEAAKKLDTDIFLATNLVDNYEGVEIIKTGANPLSDIAKFLDNEGTLLLINGNRPLITDEMLLSIIEYHNQQQNHQTISSVFVSGEEVFTDINVFEIQQFKLIISELENSGTPISFMQIANSFMEKKFKLGTHISSDSEQFVKVETYVDISVCGKKLRQRINTLHMKNGINIIDSDKTYISPKVKIGKGSIIYPNNILFGNTIIGDNCIIGANSTLTNTIVGNGTEITNSVTNDCKIGNNTSVGPFAYIRPNSVIGNNCKVGDFVEIKNSIMGDNSKASHLTYIGDSDVGQRNNIGCGTVTVNYDGSNKARTIIEDDVFIGCNANLIAPVTIKKGSFIAAGSTITQDVPENTLAIARSQQIIKEDWERPKKG